MKIDITYEYDSKATLKFEAIVKRLGNKYLAFTSDLNPSFYGEGRTIELAAMDLFYKLSSSAEENTLLVEVPMVELSDV